MKITNKLFNLTNKKENLITNVAEFQSAMLKDIESYASLAGEQNLTEFDIKCLKTFKNYNNTKYIVNKINKIFNFANNRIESELDVLDECLNNKFSRGIRETYKELYKIIANKSMDKEYKEFLINYSIGDAILIIINKIVDFILNTPINEIKSKTYGSEFIPVIYNI